MMKTAIFPMKNIQFKPAFWGVDRDLKDVVDTIDHVWGGYSNPDTPDFKETDQAYFMSLDMPGVNKDNLDVQVEDGRILIQASRKRAFVDGEGTQQKITRTLYIPELVDKDKIQAHCEDGVLYLALPKVEKAKPKKVKITENFDGGTWKNLLSNESK